MKIAFISDQFFPRTSADSEQIISSLSALGKISEVTLFTASYRSNETSKKNLEDYYQKEVTFGLQFIYHAFKNIRGIEKISYAIRIGSQLKNADFDLAYTRNIPVLLAILLFTKLPVVFESYRPWPSRNLLSRKLFKSLSTKKRLLGVVLHSKYAGKSFKDVGFTQEKLMVAHNSFSMDDYEVIPKKEILNKHKIPTDKKIIAYSGRVRVNKGVDRIFKLAEEFKDAAFLIIGSEGEGEIENRAKVYDNIHIIKWIPKQEVYSLLIASDILYIPPTSIARDKAKNTVLPLKTFLYKASGKAILAPNLDDIKEILTHKENAFLVDPDNDEKEIEAVKSLLSDAELRIRIGDRAKEEMKLLTWEKRAEKILKFADERLKTVNG